MGAEAKWQPGPQLNEGRHSHSVGICVDATSQFEYIIVTGGWTAESSYVKSTEILYPGSQQWIKGPDMQIGLVGHSMVSWNNDVIVLGGATGPGSFSSSLFKLSCLDKNFLWEKMSVEMGTARAGFVAMAVPDNFLDV